MDKNFYVPKKEWMTYCIGALGQGMIYAIMSSYISDFYLNVLKVTPIFVLLLMLLARIWDAINDPIMGYIMDRANPKKGKMKPYILYTPIPVAILTLLLFYAPNLSDSKKNDLCRNYIYCLGYDLYSVRRSVLESSKRINA